MSLKELQAQPITVESIKEWVEKRNSAYKTMTDIVAPETTGTKLAIFTKIAIFFEAISIGFESAINHFKDECAFQLKQQKYLRAITLQVDALKRKKEVKEKPNDPLIEKTKTFLGGKVEDDVGLPWYGHFEIPKKFYSAYDEVKPEESEKRIKLTTELLHRKPVIPLPDAPDVRTMEKLLSH